jgi:hypothetical protein
MLAPDRTEQLADDIRAHGLLEPITLLGGTILDGRNRYAACRMAGVEPRFEAYTGSTPYSWVASKNSQRRDLTEGSAEAGLWLAPGIMAEVETEQRKKLSAAAKAREAEKASLSRSTSASREAELVDEKPAPPDTAPTETERAKPTPEPTRNHKAEESAKVAGIVAAKVGLSRATMERAMEVQKNAPELVEQGAAQGAREVGLGLSLSCLALYDTTIRSGLGRIGSKFLCNAMLRVGITNPPATGTLRCGVCVAP